MNGQFLNIFYLAGAYLILFASAEVLYIKFKVKAEFTRKYVHVVTGLLTLLFPPLLQNHWFVLILCGSFFVILIASIRFNFLKSINAVDRDTLGSLFYPIIVYGCFLVFDYFNQYLFYYIPILVMAICDPIAALVGKTWPMGRFKIIGQSKTLSGSAGFLVSSLIVSFILIVSFTDVDIIAALMISFAVAFSTTIIEAVSYKGYDNLTIPAVALGVLLLLFNYYNF